MNTRFNIPPEALSVDSIGKTAAPETSTTLRLEPQLEPRDEAALLLTVAAEVEHALMAQYLFAAYSLRDDQLHQETQGRVRGFVKRLSQIAREEMGHLMTVQNLLHFISAPLHLHREGSPFESELYPFRFKLEPLSSGSLAKYIVAEMPADAPDLEHLKKEAKASNDGRPVQHVGAIFERLIELFNDPVNGLQDSDFRTDTADLHATFRDWGYDTALAQTDDTEQVLVEAFEGHSVSALRELSVKALTKIAQQGEGSRVDDNSHYHRFRRLYEDFHTLKDDGIDFLWPVVTNPNTTPPRKIDYEHEPLGDAIRGAFEESGYIHNTRSRNWAHLFNLRYRLLLGYLLHFLRSPGPRYLSAGPDKGDRTPRGLLLKGAFDEMRHLQKIAVKLVRLPLNDEASGQNAGPPFQLPYTLALPDANQASWRVHLDVVRASLRLLENELCFSGSPDAEDPFLQDLKAEDEHKRAALLALATGQPLPEDLQPKKWKKAAHILEEAVRGFKIGVHENFWANIDRNRFVGLHMFNRPFIARGGEPDCKLVAEGSEIVSRLASSTKSGRMPRYRPHIDPSRLEFLREWIDGQAPDNEPAGQIGVLTERAPNFHEAQPLEVRAFSAAEAPSESADIRRLFRDFDVAMLARLDGIDVNNEASLRENAGGLLARLQAGTFPYDASWPAERIDRFKRWVEAGS
jgi:hypothetical protein